MLRAGYDLGALPSPSYPFEGVTVNAAGRQLFNLRIAQQYGYAGPAQNRPPQTAPEVLSRLDQAEGQAASVECADRTAKVIPPAPSEELLTSLELAAYSSAKESEDVQRAARRWRECMAPLGIADLPRGPENMPSDSQRERFEATRKADGTAGIEEIEMAVEDAKCRGSSGWSTAMYQEEWERQLALLDENEDALERLRAANAKHAAVLETVLENADG
jgi:hypothetical protein